MPRLSLAKLERHLYAAADRLRQEGLDAATYKDYIRLMVRILKMTAGMSVYEPTCGSGGMLVQSVKFVESGFNSTLLES